MTVAVSKSL